MRPISPVVIAALALTACQSSARPAKHSLEGVPSNTTAEATLEVLHLNPPTETPLTSDSLLVATVHYDIKGFREDADYFLIPLFQKQGGTGTFNQLPGFRDGVRLKQPSGDIRLEYAIRAEWDSGRLHHPVRVFFAILEQTGLHHASSIAISREFEYSH